MAKAEFVEAQFQAVQAGQAQAVKDGLNACYDQGVADQQASGSVGGGLSQEQLDAAVAQAKSEAAAEKEAALAEQKAKFDADFAADEAEDDAKLAEALGHVASLSAALEEVSAAKALSDEKVEKFKASVDALQGFLDAFKAAIPSA